MQVGRHAAVVLEKQAPDGPHPGGQRSDEWRQQRMPVGRAAEPDRTQINRPAEPDHAGHQNRNVRNDRHALDPRAWLWPVLRMRELDWPENEQDQAGQAREGQKRPPELPGRCAPPPRYRGRHQGRADDDHADEPGQGDGDQGTRPVLEGGRYPAGTPVVDRRGQNDHEPEHAARLIELLHRFIARTEIEIARNEDRVERRQPQFPEFAFRAVLTRFTPCSACHCPPSSLADG